RLDGLERHRLGDAFDGVLAADIDRGPRRTLVPVGRGDVDNATAALSLHDAHFVLHAQDHAEDIRVERRGIAFRGLARDRANLAFGAGIVHRDIKTAKPCDGLVDQIVDFIVATNVGLDEGGFGTQLAQLGFESLALRFPTAAEHRVRTSQPSLSRQIRELEYEVGAELLSRSVHGAELTAAGKAFLHYARLALMQVDAAVEAGRRAAEPAKKSFAIGFQTG